MAKVIDKNVKLSTDDIIEIVRCYQQLTNKACCYEHVREILSKNPVFIRIDE